MTASILPSMTHDSRIGNQARNIIVTEASNAFHVKVRKSSAERLTLTKDREPTQAGLEAFQTEQLEELTIVPHRESPLTVVVGLILRILPAPPAAHDAVLATEETFGKRIR